MKRSVPSGQLRAAFFLAALLVSAYCWRIILLNEVPLFSPENNINDPAPSNLAFGPESEIISKMIHDGSSVLWTPTRDFGTPTLYEEMEGAPLHPWSWIRSLFSFTLRWRLNAVVVLFAICVAHLLMAKRIFKFSWPAAIVFAQIGALSPFLLRNLNHQYVLTYASVIWLLFFIFSGLEQDSKLPKKWLLLFLGETLSIATGIVAGFPEAFFPVLLITFFVYVVMALKYRTKIFKSIYILALASVTALALASFQVLAFFEGLHELGADSFRVGMGSVTLPWSDFSQLFIRYDFMHDNLVFYYTGAVVLFLLMLVIPLRSWRHANSHLGFGLGLSAAFFIFHVFNTIPAVHAFIASLPILNVSNFYGFFPPLLILGVAWLASSVVEKIFQDQAHLSPYTFGGIVLVYLGVMAWLSIWSIQQVFDPFDVRHLNRLLPAAVLLMMFYLFIVRQHMGPLKQPVWRKGLSVFISVALFAELFLSMYQFRYASVKAVNDLQFGDGFEQVVALLCNRPDSETYKLMSWDRILPEFCVPQPDSTAAPTPLKRNSLLKQVLFSRSVVLEQPLYSYSLPLTGIRWMIGRPQDIQVVQQSGLVYVETLALPGAWRLIEIPSALPRAYITQQCKAFASDQAVASALQTGDYTLGEALLETQDAQMITWCNAHTNLLPAVQQVPITKDSGSKISLAKFQGPGVLVLNDSYYPGWKVYDKNSGEQLDILPVNIAFKAVMLKDQKPYDLVFEYRPKWLSAAYALTASAIALILIILRVQYKKSRQVE